MSAVTVRVLAAAFRACVDTPHTASEEMRRLAAGQLADRWRKAPALVRIGAIIRVARWYW